MLTALLDLIAPPRCLSCGARAPLPWCAPCERQAIRADTGDRCPGCAGWHAGGCPLTQSGIVATQAAYTYTGVVADAVVAAKVAGATAAWPALGERLAASLSADTVADVVVPVPTDPRRRRQRGVDHARMLADAVGNRLDVSVVPLLRARPGSPDRGRSKTGDPPLPAPAITVRPLAQPSGAMGLRVLLVDDVLTTGATVRAAASALQALDVGPIEVAVLARAPR